MISVITTTYNYSQYIKEAVQSILNQSFKQFEYLIIDDGSTDETEVLVNQFKDQRIKYYKLQHIGRSAALNFAVRKAKFDIIALMDADDIAHPQRLEKEIATLKKRNQLIFCNTAYFKNKNIKYVLNSPSNSIELKSKILLHGHLNNSSVLFYKNYLVENLGYDESLIAYEDYDLWLRLLLKSEFIIISEPHHFVRLHEKSLTTSNQSKLKQTLYFIQEKYFSNLLPLITTNKTQQIKLMAWREFFYGKKVFARIYWRKLNLSDFNLKISIAYLLSFLADLLLDMIKNNRLRLRIEFVFNISQVNKNIQSELIRIRKSFKA